MKHIKSLNNFISESKYNVFFDNNQKHIAKELFKELFDFYLRTVSPKSYPYIFHCTTLDKYYGIKKHGLQNSLNYFLDNDNKLMMYGYDNDDNEVKGISCAVNYNDVIDRLFPDTEWILEIGKKLPHPTNFKNYNIDDDIILCLLITDILGIDLNNKLKISDISKQKLDFIISENLFYWLYVKGAIEPNLINIFVHKDLYIPLNHTND